MFCVCFRAEYFVLVLDILNASPDPLQVSHLSHSKATLVIPTQQSSRWVFPPIPSRCPTSPTARQPSSFPPSSPPGESSLDPLQVSHLSHSKATLVIPTQQSSRWVFPRSPPGLPPLPQQGNPRHSHPAVLSVSLPPFPFRSPTSPTARQPSSFPPSSPPGESSSDPLQVSHLSHSKATLVIPTQQSSRWVCPPGESSSDPLQVSHLSHSKATLVIPTQQSSRWVVPRFPPVSETMATLQGMLHLPRTNLIILLWSMYLLDVTLCHTVSNTFISRWPNTNRPWGKTKSIWNQYDSQFIRACWPVWYRYCLFWRTCCECDIPICSRFVVIINFFVAYLNVFSVFLQMALGDY